MAAILIVEDEPVLAHQLGRALSGAGHHVRCAGHAAAGLAAAGEDPPDLVLLDLRLPDAHGLDVLAELHRLDASLPVVLMTAYGSVPDAVEAMRRGAADYLQKPLDLEEVSLLVARLLAEQRRERELAYLRDRDRVPQGVIGNDPSLVSVFRQAERLREAELPPGKRPTILLTGETGTGKGVVARAIHELLGGGPFIEVNCTAMPAPLVEGELFGHERGSFTDARTSRAGLFEAAEGGTVFLDEIGHLDPGVQTKFLKAIEERRVRRLGSTRDRDVDVHVLAATNRDLDRAVAEGSFRADLYHRLSVLTFRIPPLRERGDDVQLLARHFCRELGSQYDGRPRKPTDEALERLARYPWPGNVRELRNAVERALLLHSQEELGPEAFGFLAAGAAGPAAPPMLLPEGGVSLESLERELTRQALERTGGNRTRAAGLLGLSRDTLRYRVAKWGLE